MNSFVLANGGWLRGEMSQMENVLNLLLKNFLTPRQNYQSSAPHERRHRGESSSLSSNIELLGVHVCTVQEEFSSDIGV